MWAKPCAWFFSPRNRDLQMGSSFPLLNIGGLLVQFVHQFIHLGHIIIIKLTDDDDIQHEICNLFIRMNILARKFKHYSMHVEV
jgi:hypothetical protein